MRLPRYFQTDDDSGPILFALIICFLILIVTIVVIGALTSPAPSDLPFPLAAVGEK